MIDRSRLVRMRIENIGPIGSDGLVVAIDKIVCFVGANNTGKSTVLRAYELAVGIEKFSPDTDLCQSAGDVAASVEIWVHIPEGIANIAEKWKTQEDDFLLVRSKWEWKRENGWAKVRTTWDPELNSYSTDDKASGLDTVFASRLPIPFRIGSLEDPKQEHQKLITLILQPVADRLQKQVSDSNSDMFKAISAVSRFAQIPVEEENERIQALKADLNRSHNAIFPDLSIDFDINIGDIEINPIQQLLKNSSLIFKEWDAEVKWSQQGTGSQRALFWTMLQVRSRLKALADIADQQKKSIEDSKKSIKKLQGEADKAKKEETRAAKVREIEEIRVRMKEIGNVDANALLVSQQNELALPGFMLLIDEPEIALHPNAIRAASQYLYGLADDPAWQVMLATHAPAFIDPLSDHTTIIRLDRSSTNPSPLTYRSDSVTFAADEKDSLKMLNRFDLSLAEMFFGQYPVLIEGDTEFAAFEEVMNSQPDVFPSSRRPIFIRARGKYTLLLIIRILQEFKVPFSILHDSDVPSCRDGSRNGAWKANDDIGHLIQTIRASGIRIVHRISLPNFELAYLPLRISSAGALLEESNKDKPWMAFQQIRSDTTVRDTITNLLRELVDPESRQAPFDGDILTTLQKSLTDWVNNNKIVDARFTFT